MLPPAPRSGWWISFAPGAGDCYYALRPQDVPSGHPRDTSMTLAAPAYPLPQQIEVLSGMEDVVTDLIEAHEAKRRLWWPSDLVGPAEGQDPDRHYAELRERARGIPDAVRISLVMGLLTEEGLPHFHRVIAQNLPEASQWRRWNNVWTAEEEC